MPLSDFAGDFPLYTADILRDAADPDNYDEESNFQKTAEVRVVVIERGGAEAFRLGLSIATKLRTVFCDLQDLSGKSYLVAPFTTADRLDVRDETLDVISIRRVTADGERLCIAETQVM